MMEDPIFYKEHLFILNVLGSVIIIPIGGIYRIIQLLLRFFGFLSSNCITQKTTIKFCSTWCYKVIQKNRVAGSLRKVLWNHFTYRVAQSLQNLLRNHLVKHKFAVRYRIHCRIFYIGRHYEIYYRMHYKIFYELDDRVNIFGFTSLSIFDGFWGNQRSLGGKWSLT